MKFFLSCDKNKKITHAENLNNAIPKLIKYGCHVFDFKYCRKKIKAAILKNVYLKSNEIKITK